MHKQHQHPKIRRISAFQLLTTIQNHVKQITLLSLDTKQRHTDCSATEFFIHLNEQKLSDNYIHIVYNCTVETCTIGLPLLFSSSPVSSSSTSSTSSISAGSISAWSLLLRETQRGRVGGERGRSAKTQTLQIVYNGTELTATTLPLACLGRDCQRLWPPWKRLQAATKY